MFGLAKQMVGRGGVVAWRERGAGEAGESARRLVFGPCS